MIGKFLDFNIKALIEKEIIDRKRTNSCIGKEEYTGSVLEDGPLVKILTKKFTNIKQTPEPII
jgi:hypothetical protein